MSKAKEFADSAGEAVDTWHSVKHAPKKEKRPEEIKDANANKGKPQNRNPAGPRGPRPAGDGQRPRQNNNRGPRGPNPNQKGQQPKDQKAEPKKDGVVGGVVNVFGEIKPKIATPQFSWAEMARKHVTEKAVAPPAPVAVQSVQPTHVEKIEEPAPQEQEPEEVHQVAVVTSVSWGDSAQNWNDDSNDVDEAQPEAEVQEEKVEEEEVEVPVVETPAPVVEPPVTHAPVAPVAAPVQRSAPTAYRPNLSQKAARADADAQKKSAPKFVWNNPVQLPTGIDEFVDTSYSFAGGAEEEEPAPQQTPHLVEASTDAPSELLLQAEQAQPVQPPAPQPQPQPQHTPVPVQSQAPAAARQPPAPEETLIYGYEEQNLHRPADQNSFFAPDAPFHQQPHQPHLHHHHHAHQHRSPQSDSNKGNQQGRGFSGKGNQNAQFNNYRGGGMPMYAPYYAPYMGMGSEYFEGYDKQPPFVQQARGPAYAAYGYYQPPYMGPMAPPWNYSGFNASQQHVPATAPQFQQPRRQNQFDRSQPNTANAAYQQGGNYFNPAANYAAGYPQYQQHASQQPGPN